jgi:hypothetical protein
MKLSWAALIIVGALASSMSASVATAADCQGVGFRGAPDNSSRVTALSPDGLAAGAMCLIQLPRRLYSAIR